MVKLLYKVLEEATLNPKALARNCWYFSLGMIIWGSRGIWADHSVWATAAAILVTSCVVTWVLLMFLYTIALPLILFLLQLLSHDHPDSKDLATKIQSPTGDDYQVLENPYRRHD